MENNIQIDIFRTETAPILGVTNKGFTIYLYRPDFEKLAQFCMENKMSPSLERTGVNYGSFHIQCAENHQSISTLFYMLADLGWKPVPRLANYEMPSVGYFSFRIIRRFTKKELDSASHLHIYRWGSDSKQLPLNWDENHEFDGYSAKLMSGCWSEDFLAVQGLRQFAVSEVGRCILEGSGLRGLVFHQIEWDIPKKAKRPFFLVDCVKKMPPCLLPIVEERSLTKVKWYLDGPYDPPILQFDRSQMDAIADVDAAWTFESLRPNPKLSMNSSPANHNLIISARFRQVLMKAKVKLVHQVVPVRWVDGAVPIDSIPPFIKHATIKDWLASIV